jgi:hypothetical protein
MRESGKDDEDRLTVDGSRSVDGDGEELGAKVSADINSAKYTASPKHTWRSHIY